MSFAAAMLLALLLAGCSRLSSPENVIDLLSSPRLSKNESMIVAAITDSLGRDIVLKYPRRNSGTLPVTMLDIDSDGTEEAIVMYSAPNLGANVRMAVLRQAE